MSAVTAVLSCLFLTHATTSSSDLPFQETFYVSPDPNQQPLPGQSYETLRNNKTCYVSPDPNQQPCPGQPCETLNNYVRNTSLCHCLGSGATMHFLPGSHILLDPVIIDNVTDLMFTGEHNVTSSHHDFEPVSKITCFNSSLGGSVSPRVRGETSKGAFIVSNSSNLTLSYLTFIGCGGFTNKGCGPHAALSFKSVTNLNITHIAVRNTTGYGLCGSNVLGVSSITYSSFTHNHAYTGHPNIFGGNMKLYFRDCPNSNRSYFQIAFSNFTDGTSDFRESYAAGLAVTIINCGNVQFKIDSSRLSSNKANNGGNMAISFDDTASKFSYPLVIQSCHIEDGTAYRGGGLHVSIVDSYPGEHHSNNSQLLHILDTTFSWNYAKGIAGGLYITHDESEFHSSPLQILVENSVFEHNTKGHDSYPGGIAVHVSTFSAASYTLHTLPRIEHVFQKCNFTDSYDSANDGFSASVFVVNEASVAFQSCNFAFNKCTALAGVRSGVLLQGEVTFHHNYAENGAGLLLCERSLMYLFPNTTVLFHDNHAKHSGGAIHADNECMQSVPPCFFQLSASVATKAKVLLPTVKVEMANNTAGSAGTNIYGGSVESCDFVEKLPYSFEKDMYIYKHIFAIEHKPSDISSVTSDPIGVCFCNASGKCNSNVPEMEVDVLPGKTFNISVAIVGQRDGAVPGVVVTHFQNNWSHPCLNQADYVQNIRDAKCTMLNFTLFSINSSETLVLQPQRPLYTKHKFPPIIVVAKLKDCPIGFSRSNSTHKCDCIRILEQHSIVCDINKQAIHRVAPTWIGYEVTKSTSLVLFHSHCPFDYCKASDVEIRVGNETLEQNAQCAFHREGMLCGQCMNDRSLMLGSSRCSHCTNVYILLVIIFALAGFLLVLMLVACNLTVTEGTLSGLIFYANIVQLNNSAFFPPPPRRELLKILAGIPAVFIAWLNLDLGIEVCFFKGMDTYLKTWLQFAFPIYLWAIAGVLIVSSRRYNCMSRLLGKNAVKMLATLFLLSYTKLQRAVVMAVSSAVVATSQGSHKAVWLFDGNLQYLHGKHIPLFLFAVIVGLASLPYTLSLFFITCLQRTSMFKFVICVNRLKPFFDAYTGPYSDKWRFWPGLLLVARAVLLTVHAFNIIGNPKINLTMSVCVCIVILTLSWINRGGIHKLWLLDILEGFFIANLGILSATTAYFETSDWERSAFAYTSFGLSFLVFVVILIYHSLKAAANSQYCQMTRLHRHFTHYCPWNRDGYETIAGTTGENDDNRELEGTVDPDGLSQNPHPFVHRRFDLFREPLLEHEALN